ncbi:MAG: RNA polymerase sigma factor [Xanthomonadales bacterium]|nr:RNA polymerase sigma factor [Xanthomonadales bacterium]
MKRRFRQLVKMHQDRLYSTAVQLLGHSGEAEEVVQDVFVKLWDHLEELEEARVLPWLIRVTRNACLDLLRRRQVHLAFAVSGGVDERHVDNSTPAEELGRVRLRDELRAAIDGLDEPFRSLVVLREIEGFSYDDIGTALKLNESQVKVYLHRARRKLRERLQEFKVSDDG